MNSAVSMITLRRTAAFTIAIAFGIAASVSAQGVGTIAGTVTDESGAVLPGVTVTLSSPGVIGGNQTAISNDAGAYQFLRLVPGPYGVKGELQGFRAVVQEGVLVNADRTSRVDMKLAIGDLSETVTVAAQAPLLDTASALNQTPMTRQVIDTLPAANDIWSIARLAPAVQLNRYDVGGREMTGQSRAIVHASIGAEYGYMIDGLDINSYASGISFQVDSSAFSEINYQTSNAPAEQSRSGVQINMITKTGTNVFHGAGMFQGRLLEGNNVSSELRTQLLAGVPRAALEANPDLEPGGRLDRLWDSSATWSGPVLKDRLWFLTSGRIGEVYAYRVGSYSPDGTQLLLNHQLINTMAKGSWAVNQSNQLHFTHAFVRKGRFTEINQTGSATEFFEREATHYNDSRNQLFTGKWTSILSPWAVLDVAGVTTYGNNNQQPQRDPEVLPGALPRYDLVTLVNSGAKFAYRITEGHRYNLGASLTMNKGSHDIKVGWQLVQNSNKDGDVSLSHAPSGLRAVYRNGVPDSVNTYNTPTAYTRWLNEHGVYIQDTWKPASRLTLNLGLRYETLYAWINDGESQLCQVATIFIAGQCFPAVTGVPDWKTVVPRMAAIYDVFGNGRTALKFSANQYKIPQDTFVNTVNPIRSTNDTRTWADSNGDLVPQLNELGPSTGFNLGTTNRYAEDVRWPSVREIAAEVEQQLPGQVVVALGYYYRAHRDQIGSRNLAVTREGYRPVAVTEALTGQRVTVYDQDPATRGRFDTLWSNEPGLDRDFNGVDVSLTKRMSKRWMMLGSVSLGKTDTDIQGTADLNNPNFDAFRRGLSDTDVPVQAKLSGSYELPYGISLSANAQYTSGLPETTIVRVTAATVRLTQVNQNIVVEPRGTTRLPSVTMFDLKLRKSIRVGQLAISPRLDMFNLFNASAVTARVAQLGPTYGRASELLGGRLIKAGFNLTW